MIKELERIKKEHTEINDKLKELKENEFVKKYIELNSRRIELEIDFKRLSFEHEVQKLESCNHIFINGHVSRYFDGHRYCTDEYKYCVKCGLDSKYLEEDERFLTELQREMIYIYRRNNKGIYWDHECDPKVASEIFKKIKTSFPEAPDKELLEYFKVAINNYENELKEQKLKIKK